MVQPGIQVDAGIRDMANAFFEGTPRSKEVAGIVDLLSAQKARGNLSDDAMGYVLAALSDLPQRQFPFGDLKPIFSALLEKHGAAVGLAAEFAFSAAPERALNSDTGDAILESVTSPQGKHFMLVVKGLVDAAGAGKGRESLNSILDKGYSVKRQEE
jgi:hypothetical protein